jgi:glycosyltransferase involved in cell wall biosynthesis
MTEPTLVSVVTPCHNAEAFIGQTIESVLAQSHRPIEHVIVDDGSADGSWAVIEGYAERHRTRVRTERLPAAGGASHARNHGAGLARGEFLMFLDADDLLSADAIAALLAALRDGEHSDSIAHAPWRRLVRDRRGAWRERPSGLPRPRSDPDTALREWLEGRAWVPPCAVLWPRPVFDRIGGWDEELTIDDDGELMRRALSRGVPLTAAGGGGALYRMHEPARVSLSQSAMTEEELRRTGKAVIDATAAELESQGRLAEFAPALGTAYQQLALTALQQGHRGLAGECQALGDRLGGRADVSRTTVGRALVRMVGLERKERLVQWLAGKGIASTGRRITMRRREMHAGRGPGEPGP